MGKHRSPCAFPSSATRLHLFHCCRPCQAFPFLPFQHLLCCGQYAYHLQTNSTMSTWLCSLTNSIGKIFTFQSQWLNPINVRDSYFAITIRDNGISMHIGPFIVNLEHFCLVGIIINGHSLIPNDRDTPDFARVKPADMNMCCHPIGKTEMEMSHI